jgi:hypothetical protein
MKTTTEQNTRLVLRRSNSESCADLDRHREMEFVEG